MTLSEKTRPPRRHGRNAIYALLAMLGAGIAILWSWNTLSAGLYGQPEMEFRHALAVEVLAAGVGALLAIPGMLSRARQSER